MKLEDYLNKMMQKRENEEIGAKHIEKIQKGNEKYTGNEFSARNILYSNIYSHDEHRNISYQSKVKSIDDIFKHLPNFEVEDTQSMVTGVKTPYRAVVGNINDIGFYAGAVGQKYTHLEHNEAVKNTLEYINQNNYEVDRVYINNDTVRIQAVNPDNYITDNKGMPIYSGVEINNSVGGKGSYSVGIFTMQQWCKNGMAHNLGSVKAKFKHTNDLTINTKVKETIDKAVQGTQQVFEILKDMQNRELTKEFWSEIKPYVCFDKKTIAGIDAMFSQSNVNAFESWRYLTKNIENKIDSNRVKSISTVDRYRNDIENLTMANKSYFISKSSIQNINGVKIEIKQK